MIGRSASHETSVRGVPDRPEFTPRAVTELSEALGRAHTARTPVHTWDLRQLDRVLEHTPEDLTVSVQAGLTLENLQTTLAKSAQWLPIDPPHAANTMIEQLLSYNLSGPRRLGYGTIREHLLGLTVVLADGRVIHNGGKVVKNVAGYDLCKLYVGHRGTLGIIVEATFKVQPRPQREAFLGATFESLAAAGVCLERVLTSSLLPVALDLHHEALPGQSQFHVVAGFAGRAEDVAWQLEQARALDLTQPANLDHERFWTGDGIRSLSVLPSQLISAIEMARPQRFIARAGNGALHYQGGQAPPSRPFPAKLAQRVKDLFDPHHILPGTPW